MMEPPTSAAQSIGPAVTMRSGRGGLVRVPEITALFWLVKALTTALGESTSDWSVHAVAPVAAVLLGFAGFLVTLGLQLRQQSYVPWAYWLAVVGVGVFGTMAADVLHVGFGVPYAESSLLYAAGLAVVFGVWGAVEHTLSIHDIDSTRRQLFYWAAVVATFALGTAVGDLSAITLRLGYLPSIWLFAGLIALPALGYWRMRLSPVLMFWTAYVLTRPLGASVADWLGKPQSAGGLGWGGGPVAFALALTIALLVAYVSVAHTRQASAGSRLPLRAPIASE